MTKKCKFGL